MTSILLADTNIAQHGAHLAALISSRLTVAKRGNGALSLQGGRTTSKRHFSRRVKPQLEPIPVDVVQRR